MTGKGFRERVDVFEMAVLGNQLNSSHKESLITLTCKQTYEHLRLNERLRWCTTWINLLTSKQIDLILKMSGSNGMLSVIELCTSCMTSSTDQYLQYVAQKVFIMIMRLQKTEIGVLHISECLMRSSTCEDCCIILDVCRQLLSKMKPNCQSFLSEVQTALQQHCTYWVPVICSQASAGNQYIFVLSNVFIKVIKLVKSNNSHASELLVWFIKTFSPILVDIMANNEFMFYAKRQLIKLFYGVAKLQSYKQSCEVSLAIVQMSKDILRMFDISLLKTAILRNEETSFGGTVSKGQENPAPSPDMVQVREWLYLWLNVLAVSSESSVPKGKDVEYLQHMQDIDDCISEMLKAESTSIFPWLADVFGDQDDMWIDVLLLMFHIDTAYIERVDPIPESLCQVSLPHHLYFLQFVSSVNYDHLVLVDLLTSPETPFLAYLTKYLRHLVNTWSELVQVAAAFEDKRDPVHDLIRSSYGASIAAGDGDDKDDDEEEDKGDDDKEGYDLRNINPASRPYLKDDEFRKEQLHMIITEQIRKQSVWVDNSKHSPNVDLAVQNSCFTSLDLNSKLTQTTDVASKAVTSSLSLLMDAYNDSDTESIEVDKLDAETEEIQAQREVNELDIDTDYIDELKETDNSYIVDDNACTGEDIVLDKVMSMLIRVRLQLERLWSHEILQYNPNILMALIECIEDKYEAI